MESYMRFWSGLLVTLAGAVVPLSAHAQAAQSAPTYDFSGLVFGNFQMRVDSAAKFTTGGKPTNRFDVGRAYLTFRFPTGEKTSARITTDIFQQSNPASSAYYGGWSVRLKYGYLQYDATKNLAGIDGLAATARIGMLHTVVVEHIETFWPRWLGNAPPELHGFFSSADLGAAGLLTLPGRRGEVYMTVTNGPGYTAAENDRFKDVAMRVSLTPFANDSGWYRTFTITPWYYKGWLASSYTQATPAVSEGLQQDRRGLFVGLRDRRLTFGAEFDQRIEELETTAPPAPRGALIERTSRLVSGFGIVRPTELFDSRKRSRLALIGRFDQFHINQDADPHVDFLTAGAIWELSARTSIALDYQSTTPRSGAPGTAVQTWFLHWTAAF
jgi:hypothetical protein